MQDIRNQNCTVSYHLDQHQEFYLWGGIQGYGTINNFAFNYWSPSYYQAMGDHPRQSHYFFSDVICWKGKLILLSKHPHSFLIKISIQTIHPNSWSYQIPPQQVNNSQRYQSINKSYCSLKIFYWILIIISNCVILVGAPIKQLANEIPFVELMNIWLLKCCLGRSMMKRLIFGV